MSSKSVDLDGDTIRYATVASKLECFFGAAKITTLAAYPLKYHKEKAQLHTQLIERGAKFLSLQGK